MKILLLVNEVKQQLYVKHLVILEDIRFILYAFFYRHGRYVLLTTHSTHVIGCWIYGKWLFEYCHVSSVSHFQILIFNACVNKIYTLKLIKHHLGLF